MQGHSAAGYPPVPPKPADPVEPPKPIKDANPGATIISGDALKSVVSGEKVLVVVNEMAPALKAKFIASYTVSGTEWWQAPTP